jgi:hypothetical protein
VVTEDEPPLPWSTAPGIPTAVIGSDSGVLSGQVEIRPPTPRVGEVVRIRLTGTDVRGRFTAGYVDIGELHRRVRPIASCPYRPREKEATPKPRTTTHVEEFVFHAPGRHTVFGMFDASTCGTSSELVVEGQVEVLPGLVPANTRHAPRAQLREVDARHQGGGPGRTFEVDVSDPDGFLEGVMFDWGDGASVERVVPYPVVHCERVPARMYPSSGRQTMYASHEFVGPGRFVVRASVTTTSCAGDNRQTTEAEWVVEMP